MSRNWADAFLWITFYPIIMLAIKWGIQLYFKVTTKQPETNVKEKRNFLNFGIVAVALAMHSTSVSALAVSSTSAARYGLSGPVWFLVGNATPLCLMGIIVTRFRTRVPGAETFPQLMLALFGKRVHLLFCSLIILNNISTIASVITTGCTFYSIISKDVSFELAWIITVIVAEICISIGGISDLLPFSFGMFIYLQIIAITIAVKVFFYGKTGSIENVYNATLLRQLKAENKISLLSMRNLAPIEMGMARSSEVLFDQALWDTCSFFVPGQESWGLIVMILIWCAFPLMFGNSWGFGNLVLASSKQESLVDVVSPAEIARHFLGPNGLFVVFSMYALIVTTATVLQISSITKILTLDIYAVHLRPFRVCYDINCCVFCGKSKDEITRPKDKCQCCDLVECQQCQEDLRAKTNDGHRNNVLGCHAHSLYLKYVRGLEKVHRTATLVVLCVAVPMGFVLNYFSAGDIILSKVPKNCIAGAIGSYILALFWDNLTESAVFIGTLASSALVLATWIMLCILRSFTNLTLHFGEINLLASGTGILWGFLIPITISLVTKRVKTEESGKNGSELKWKRTLDLGNPINPWPRTYAQIFHLPLSQSGALTVEQIVNSMKTSRIVANAGLVFYIALMGFFIGLGCIPEVFTPKDFKAWIICIFSWLTSSLLFAVFLPILSWYLSGKRIGDLLTRQLMARFRRQSAP